MLLRLTAALTFLACSSTLQAQEWPISSLPKYSIFRQALINKGWRPDKEYGAIARNKDGSPMYGFPEVVCGNSMCTAQWFRGRKKIGITLWPNGSDLRVAPQWE